MNKMIFKNAAGFGWGFILGFNVLRLMEGQKPEAEKKKPVETVEVEVQTNEPQKQPGEIKKPAQIKKILPIFLQNIQQIPVFQQLPGQIMRNPEELADMNRWYNNGNTYRFVSSTGYTLIVGALTYFYLRINGIVSQNLASSRLLQNLVAEISNYIRNNRPVSFISDNLDARQNVLRILRNIDVLNNLISNIQTFLNTYRPQPREFIPQPSAFPFMSLGESVDILPDYVETKREGVNTAEITQEVKEEKILIIPPKPEEIPVDIIPPPNAVEITYTTEEEGKEEIPEEKPETQPPEEIPQISRGRQNVNLGSGSLTETLQNIKKEEKPEPPKIEKKAVADQNSVSNFAQGLINVAGYARKVNRRYGPVIEEIINNARNMGSGNISENIENIIVNFEKLKNLAVNDDSELAKKIKSYFQSEGYVLGSAPQENYLSPAQPFQFFESSGGTTHSRNFADILDFNLPEVNEDILKRLLVDPSFFAIVNGQRIEGIEKIYENLRLRGKLYSSFYTALRKFFNTLDFSVLTYLIRSESKSPLIQSVRGEYVIIDDQYLISLQYMNYLLRILRTYANNFPGGNRSILSISQARNQIYLDLRLIDRGNAFLLEAALQQREDQNYRIISVEELTETNFSSYGEIIKILIEFLKDNSGRISLEYFTAIQSTISLLFSKYSTEIGSTRENLLNLYSQLKFIEPAENAPAFENLDGVNEAVKAYLTALILLGINVNIFQEQILIIRGKYQKK